MPGDNSSLTDLGLAADRTAARDATAADATTAPDATTPDATPANNATAHGDDARRDPPPDAVPGDDDAGAEGRDRAHGGWGDRGLFGGRAGGTGG